MNENLQLKKQIVQKKKKYKYQYAILRLATEKMQEKVRERKRERELQGKAMEEQTFAPAGNRMAMADSIIIIVSLFSLSV